MCTACLPTIPTRVCLVLLITIIINSYGCRNIIYLPNLSLIIFCFSSSIHSTAIIHLYDIIYLLINHYPSILQSLRLIWILMECYNIMPGTCIMCKQFVQFRKINFKLKFFSYCSWPSANRMLPTGYYLPLTICSESKQFERIFLLKLQRNFDNIYLYIYFILS